METLRSYFEKLKRSTIFTENNSENLQIIPNLLKEDQTTEYSANPLISPNNSNSNFKNSNISKNNEYSILNTINQKLNKSNKKNESNHNELYQEKLLNKYGNLTISSQVPNIHDIQEKNEEHLNKDNIKQVTNNHFTILALYIRPENLNEMNNQCINDQNINQQINNNLNNNSNNINIEKITTPVEITENIENNSNQIYNFPNLPGQNSNTPFSSIINNPPKFQNIANNPNTNISSLNYLFSNGNSINPYYDFEYMKNNGIPKVTFNKFNSIETPQNDINSSNLSGNNLNMGYYSTTPMVNQQLNPENFSQQYYGYNNPNSNYYLNALNFMRNQNQHQFYNNMASYSQAYGYLPGKNFFFI